MRREQSEVCRHNGFRDYRIACVAPTCEARRSTGDDDVKANKLRLISKSGLPSRRFAPRLVPITRFPSNATQRPGKSPRRTRISSWKRSFSLDECQNVETAVLNGSFVKFVKQIRIDLENVPSYVSTLPLLLRRRIPFPRQKSVSQTG